jgi:precorrin-2 C20-methyltransferase/precorrin-3B C17-methyltransferase
VLIGYETYLNRVPVRPGQERLATDNRVELERAAHAIELARAGRRVAVVSSGDPGIFAMATAVLEAVEDRSALGDVDDLDVRIVPGLSAMQAAAARAGAPLGHDFCVISLSDQLKPWAVIERRLKAASRADLVLALYNPASRTRRTQLVRALEVLRAQRHHDTPVVVARAVGAAEEAVTVTTLAQLDPAAVDMRTLLIVGSSTTRALPGGRVYTPRRYPG